MEKAHRWSMLVSEEKFRLCWMRQSSIDVDFVEICCSDAPCLTEAMQQREISSFSLLLRSNGVGNHDAQTREKLLGWFSVKTTSEGLVLTTGHRASEQFDTSRQIFRQFFGHAAAVLQ